MQLGMGWGGTPGLANDGVTVGIYHLVKSVSHTIDADSNVVATREIGE